MPAFCMFFYTENRLLRALFANISFHQFIRNRAVCTFIGSLACDTEVFKTRWSCRCERYCGAILRMFHLAKCCHCFINGLPRSPFSLKLFYARNAETEKTFMFRLVSNVSITLTRLQLSKIIFPLATKITVVTEIQHVYCQSSINSYAIHKLMFINITNRIYRIVKLYYTYIHNYDYVCVCTCIYMYTHTHIHIIQS